MIRLFASEVILAIGVLIPVVLSGIVVAAPVTITDTSVFRDIRGPNTVDFGEGDLIVLGATVFPEDSIVRAGIGLNGNACPTPLPINTIPGVCRVRELLFRGDLPGRFSRTIPFDPTLTGSWRIEAFNGPDSATATTNVLGITEALPFARNAKIEGIGLEPTISWTLPSTAGPFTDVLIGLFDDDSNFRLLIDGSLLVPIPLNMTSFTFPPGLLEDGKKYVIRVVVDQRVSGIGSINRATTFINFVPLRPGDPSSVLMPTVKDVAGVPTYFFDIDVQSGAAIFIDPPVALGYDYEIGPGNPHFESVLLPEVGDNIFDIYLWNGSKYVFHASIGAGLEYKFPPGGVDRFRVLGIEASAGLDPNNVVAFITGVTFVSDGQFTGTMTPIVAEAFCSILGNDPKPSLLDQDIFTFQGTQGEKVVIGLEKSGNNNSSGDKATLMLVDNIPRAFLLEIDNGSLPSKVDALLPATGEYLAIVAEQPLIARGSRYRGPYCITAQSSGNAAGTLQPKAWVE
jgi:hypothetical protein